MDIVRMHTEKLCRCQLILLEWRMDETKNRELGLFSGLFCSCTAKDIPVTS